MSPETWMNRGLLNSCEGIREDAWACSQHHPQGFPGGAVPGASVVCPTAAGPGEDSSYSELEQEGPQKLIHKVSTSEQMGTKELPCCFACGSTNLHSCLECTQISFVRQWTVSPEDHDNR
ncbi:diacylglycerol kinase eta-like isoform X1 [Mus musculus]|uniref:diacylglycerol kinase eta-like isoform X1 n=1 Tax=Mus musculus TaxID=10090 RepID=UPI0003D6EEC8|nr:diacylglycerol kinase eta-like isoform X1 [Mus musculus]|eukprot:XP_006518309.1 PREDICTED: diacylglycerol kinase eta-like isoform X1 [Mus musculus]